MYYHIVCIWACNLYFYYICYIYKLELWALQALETFALILVRNSTKVEVVIYP